MHKINWTLFDNQSNISIKSLLKWPFSENIRHYCGLFEFEL